MTICVLFRLEKFLCFFIIELYYFSNSVFLNQFLRSLLIRIENWVSSSIVLVLIIYLVKFHLYSIIPCSEVLGNLRHVNHNKICTRPISKSLGFAFYLTPTTEFLAYTIGAKGISYFFSSSIYLGFWGFFSLDFDLGWESG